MPMQMYKQELERLQNETLALGGMVEKSVVESVDMLKRRDLVGAQRLISSEGQFAGACQPGQVSGTHGS